MKTIYIKRNEYEQMRNRIADEATGASEFDIFEFEHYDDDIRIY